MVDPKLNEVRVEAGAGTGGFSAPSAEDVSALAYEYWVAKGCPAGSHEEDWRQAEEELYARMGLAKAAGA